MLKVRTLKDLMIRAKDDFSVKVDGKDVGTISIDLKEHAVNIISEQEGKE